MALSVALLCIVGIVTNAVELAHPEPDVRFDLTGIITFTSGESTPVIALEDRSGAITLANETVSPHVDVVPGDRIRAWGVGDVLLQKRNRVRLNCKEIRLLSHGPAPQPHETAIQDLQDGKYDFRLVRFPCILRDVFADEIDAGYLFLTLSDGDETITAALRRSSTNEARFASLIGAKLTATGLCRPTGTGNRSYNGRHLSITDPDTAFAINEIPGRHPFDLPGIGVLDDLSPSRIARHGRCRAIGTVLAVWDGNRALLRDKIGREFGATFVSAPVPKCGSFVEVAGLPATDLYHINLLRAIWRTTPGNPVKDELPAPATIVSLFTDDLGRDALQPKLHARVLRIVGTVKAVDAKERPAARLYLEDSGRVLPVDFGSAVSAVENLGVGSRVELTGICVMEGDNWTPYTPFPQLRSILLVLRTPADIRVLSRPSWWTPARLSGILAALFTILIAILLWNLLLRKAIRRREHELKDEIFARVGADLKFHERTELAVELHDSLSQGLTGISLELSAAERLLDKPEELRRHLGVAVSSLRSCRNDLRNCLWDLRNNTLEEGDMDESIRRTLVPVVGDADMRIRFNVPRTRLPDSSTHALLCIIRELVTNALRHGKADMIRIAGNVEDGRLSFSVRDNGRGFCPSSAPGIREGHFGLQGIRDRIRRFDGTIEIESNPGSGTKVTVTMLMPDREKGISA